MSKRTASKLILVAAAVAAAVFGWTLLAQAGTAQSADIRGGGTTIVRGGTGPHSFTPVLTKFGFSWREGKGGFECLALVPSAAAGQPGSGEFNTNAMYVTGSLSSAAIQGDKAVLKGTATVTGLGAGDNKPFTATATRGGPGATLVLEVS